MNSGGTEASSAAADVDHPWPVKALSWLLFLQAAGFLGLAAFYYMDQEPLREAITTVRALILNSSVRAIVFAILTILALVTAASFRTLWTWGLTLANLVQSASLLTALIQYAQGVRALNYAVMVYGILMVVYLNHPDVRAAFSSAGANPPQSSSP